MNNWNLVQISVDFEHTNISEPNTALKSTYLKIHDGNGPGPGFKS